MRFLLMRSEAAAFVLLMSIAISIHGNASAQTAEEVRWSVDFGSISLSEAFDQLTLVTGIKIYTPTPLVQRISPKRYMNQSIEQILKDMLKQVNYAAVWHYSRGGIESVWILAFDREIAERHDNRGQRDQESPMHSRFAESGELSQTTDHSEETPEPEEAEVEQSEEESEQLPLEQDDTSNLASADLHAEPAEDSPNREESRAGEQQGEREE